MMQQPVNLFPNQNFPPPMQMQMRYPTMQKLDFPIEVQVHFKNKNIGHVKSEQPKKCRKYNNLLFNWSDLIQKFEAGPPPKIEKLENREQRKKRMKREKRRQNQKNNQENKNIWNPFDNQNATSDPYNTLYVGRLSYETSEKKLRKEFEQYGTIKNIKIVQNTIKGKPRGYAFIEYETRAEMVKAYKFADDKKIDGKRILVDFERGRTMLDFLPRRVGGGIGNPRAPIIDATTEKDQSVEKEKEKGERGDKDVKKKKKKKNRSQSKQSASGSRSRSRHRKKQSRSRSQSKNKDKKSKKDKKDEKDDIQIQNKIQQQQDIQIQNHQQQLVQQQFLPQTQQQPQQQIQEENSKNTHNNLIDQDRKKEKESKDQKKKKDKERSKSRKKDKKKKDNNNADEDGQQQQQAGDRGAEFGTMEEGELKDDKKKKKKKDKK